LLLMLAAFFGAPAGASFVFYVRRAGRLIRMAMSFYYVTSSVT